LFLFSFHDSEVEYYIPAGKWTSFWDPSVTVVGPRWVKETNVPLDTIPIFVRPGSVLPLGPFDVKTPDYSYTEDIELRAYGLEEGQNVEVVLPTGKGTGVAAKILVSLGGEGATGRKEGGLKVEVKEGKLGSWKGVNL